KLLHILRTRGLQETALFVLSRVVRSQTHLLFCNDNAGQGIPIKWNANEVVFEATQASELDALTQRCGDLPDDIAEYLAAIRSKQAIGIFIFVEDRLAHWAFVMKQSRTACYLGFPDPAVGLLGSAFTVPEFRGRGLQTRSVAHRTNLAWRHGYTTVISETAPENEPSARALQAGGMQSRG